MHPLELVGLPSVVRLRALGKPRRVSREPREAHARITGGKGPWPDESAARAAMPVASLFERDEKSEALPNYPAQPRCVAIPCYVANLSAASAPSRRVDPAGATHSTLPPGRNRLYEDTFI